MQQFKSEIELRKAVVVSMLGQDFWIYIGLSLFILLLSTVYYIYRKRHQRIPLTGETILKLLQQSKPFPLGSAQGWTLADIIYGQRVWQNRLMQDVPRQPPASLQVYGCYSKVKGSAQTILTVLTDIKKFAEWKTTLLDVTQPTTPELVSQTKSQSTSSKSSKTSQEGSTCQTDVITGTMDFNTSVLISMLNRLSLKMKGQALKQMKHNINRYWNKEENGCCWLLEMNRRLEEWTFFLAQPEEKWFEIDHCILTVISFPHHGRSGQKSSMPAKILTSFQNYLLYRKTVSVPLINITVLQEVDKKQVKNIPVVTTQEAETNTTDPPTPSKAKNIFDDVVAKFTKEEGKSEPLFIQKFRNLIEEKKEWYEDRKRKAAAKVSSDAAKAKEEAEGILHNDVAPTDQSDLDHDDRQILEHSQIDESQKSRLVKSRTIDCTNGVDNGDDDINYVDPGIVGHKLVKNYHLRHTGRSKSDGMIYLGHMHQQEPSHDEDIEDEEVDSEPFEEIEDENPLERSLRVIGKTTGAELLSMKSKISQIDIQLPYDQQAERSGGWIYCGLEREVVILRKIYDEGSTMQSYLGKGLIACPPKTVFEALRNPRTRFTYDDMLKKMDVLHEFDSTLKIVHWQHEVSQLFKRECRDFCILQHEEVEGSKFIISLRSVQWPPCKKNHDITRATLHASGWIIEPSPRDNTLHSMVTYIVQMELGPSKTNTGYLMEELAAKQPLSVAFLRQYLVPSASRNSTSNQARRRRITNDATDSQGNQRNTLASLAEQYQSLDKNSKNLVITSPANC